MPVDLSIKDVPDDWAERLREQAARRHRSLQNELMAIVEAAVFPKPISVVQFAKEMAALGPGSPSESAQIVREMRDSRYGDKGR
jgi:plasmid stability protein